MFGAKHQWIITGGYPEEWWAIPDPSITCSSDDLNITINGYIATDVLPLSSSNEVTESGLVNDMLQLNIPITIIVIISCVHSP